MSLMQELHNDVEIINQEDYDLLDEGAQRAYRRVGNAITQYYRCTSGPKKGKLAASPQSCGQRKDPAKVRHGRRVARTKGAIRIRKTVMKKRTQLSKRVTKLNKILSQRRKSSTKKPKKVGESFIEFMINDYRLVEESDYNIPSREEIIADVVTHGPDSEWLYFLKYKDMERLVNSGKIGDEIYSHWENAQEEMRVMRSEFGESFTDPEQARILLENIIYSAGDFTKLVHEFELATKLSRELSSTKLDEILKSSGYSDNSIVDVMDVRYKIVDTKLSLIVTFQYDDGSEHNKHGTVYLTNDGRKWNADF